MLVQLVLFDDLIGHGDSERLHGVTVGVVVGADHLVEVVDHVLFVIDHILQTPPICIYLHHYSFPSPYIPL